jgi:hypothetical protein
MNAEEMLNDLSDQVNEDSGLFTEWELEFIEDLSAKVVEGVDLTESQEEKIREIWEDRLG